MRAPALLTSFLLLSCLSLALPACVVESESESDPAAESDDDLQDDVDEEAPAPSPQFNDFGGNCLTPKCRTINECCER